MTSTFDAKSALHSLEVIPQFRMLPPDLRNAIRVAACVLPFKTNSYITNELIDWRNAPDDPLFQMNFPQPGMLADDDFARVMDLLHSGVSPELQAAVAGARMRLMPMQGEAASFSPPTIDNRPVMGLCHQFRETVLAFPSPCQPCFAVCTFCYRWTKHLGAGREFCYTDAALPVRYLAGHPEVSDLQFTGGDPMNMSAAHLRQYVAPLLGVETLRAIRFSTRALSWWPYRFTTDGDADQVLRVFEDIVKAGKHCAVMAHFTHPRELATDAAAEAIPRIRSTGAVIRSQAPILFHVNASPAAWTELWSAQVQLGIVPYYMFVDSDAGPRGYFKIPLARAIAIYNEAWRNVSGLARTVRGPVYYSADSKILMSALIEMNGKKAFLMKYLQASNPAKTGQCFRAGYDETSTAIDQLTPLSL